MTHRTIGAGLSAAALALTLAAAPAQAQGALATTYYFKYSGPQPAVKLQNGATLASPSAAWSTAKPTASFQSGAGCGFLDAPAPGGTRPSTTPENVYDAFYKGVHEKAIATAKIELHNLVTSRARQGATQNLLVRISEGTGTTAKTLAEKSFAVTPVLSSTGLTERFDFEFTGLNIPASPARFLNITVHSLEPTPQAWVHDAAEIPASVTFTEPEPVPAS